VDEADGASPQPQGVYRGNKFPFRILDSGRNFVGSDGTLAQPGNRYDLPIVYAWQER
jgi:hypothetical protein